MGPLRYGIRRPLENTTEKHFIRRMDTGKVRKIKELELTMQPLVPVGQAEAPQEIAIAEAKRLARAQQITEAMAGLSLKQSKTGSKKGSSMPSATAKRDKSPASESESDLAAREEGLRISITLCRWIGLYSAMSTLRRNKTILDYILNIAEQKIALETMGLLPEPTFYRYIRDFNKEQNKFELRVQQFKAFLSQCNWKKELFM